MTRFLHSLFGPETVPTTRRRGRLGVEMLEDRRLLSASAIYNPIAQQIEITGTAAHEMVSVNSLRDSTIRITMQNTDAAGNPVVGSLRICDFSPTDVQRIVFNGNEGDDQFFNNTGLKSTALGGKGADWLVGGWGTDTLDGGDDADRLDGRDGNDVLRGGNDNDILDGSSGDDSLEGGKGNDTLRGWYGNDTYVFAGTGLGADTVFEYAGLGTDTLDFTAAGFAAAVDLGTLSRQTMGLDILGVSQLDLTLISTEGIENVRGGSFDDVITGNDLNNQLEGFAGSDRIDGFQGNDVLRGGPGSDTYAFGRATFGTFTIDELGNQDKDTLDFSAQILGVTIDLARTGPQAVNSFVTLNLTGATGIEKVIGTGERDIIHGNSRDNFLDGRAGNDRLFGEGGNDELLGGGGDDDLFGGGAGNYHGDPGDRLFGENGQDVLIGGGELWGGDQMDMFVNGQVMDGKWNDYFGPEGNGFDANSADDLLPPDSSWDDRLVP